MLKNLERLRRLLTKEQTEEQTKEQTKELKEDLPYNEYPKWHNELQQELKAKIKQNMYDRTDSIELIVNRVIKSYSVKKNISFKYDYNNKLLTDNDKLKIVSYIENEIDYWKGINIDSCTIPKKTFKEYKITGIHVKVYIFILK